MKLDIKNTKDWSLQGTKACIYGRSGMGKTFLSSTAPSPFIISTESGLLSLQDFSLPYIEIKSVNDIKNVYQYLTESEDAKNFKTICLDSITDIAEVILKEYKKGEKDARQAYGRLNDDMSEIIRMFRDIKGKHVYFTAQEVKHIDDSTSAISYYPGMPGKTLTGKLSYFFDEVFALRMTAEGVRYLQTSPTAQYEAKDRSGKLADQEEPNLTKIFDKIANNKTKEVKK